MATVPNTAQLGVPVGLVNMAATALDVHLITIEYSIDRQKIAQAIEQLRQLADTLHQLADAYDPV